MVEPDPLTWRIKLREGVKWQKGFGEMTADDLVYTWNFHLESKSFQVGTALFPLDTVKADGRRVEVKTKQPFGAFPGVTMGYGGTIISAKAHKEMGNQAYSATPIGNGPFQIDTSAAPRSCWPEAPRVLEARLAQARPDRHRAIPTSTTRLQALVKNELDFVTHPDPKGSGRACARTPTSTSCRRRAGNGTISSSTSACTDLPYHNKLVRQAISYAIDREAIVKKFYYGEAIPTDNQIPAGYMGHRGPMLKYPRTAT